MVSQVVTSDSTVSVFRRASLQVSPLARKGPALGLIFIAVWVAQLISVAARAAAPSDLENKYGPRPVDGVYVEAVQSYIPPKHNQFGLDFGLWPLNPYYNGFSIDLNYTYHFSKDSAWEIVNLSYVYTVDSSLTQELASNYAVSPKAIERLDSVISSNYNWNILYGKFAFLSNNIRYFRSGLLAGPALIVTSSKANIGACIGWSIETFVNEKMAWKFQIRDNYAFGNDHPNNLAFLLGTTYGF